MQTRRSIRIEKRKQDRQGILLIACSLLAMVGMLTLVLTLEEGPVNTADNCPLSGETGHFIVILDKTDPLNPNQVKQLKTSFNEFARTVRRGERVSIYKIDGAWEAGEQAVFSKCSTGRAEEVWRLFESRRAAAEKFGKNFKEEYDRQVDGLLQAQYSKTSPILELLFDLTNRPGFKPEKVTRLIIVSDMIQNSSALDMYKSFDPSVITADWLEKTYGRRVRLPSIEVEIWQVRGKYPEEQLARARRAWDRIASVHGIRLRWQSL